MSLAAGSRLGPYEIVRLLGAGGMGEVYAARDSRLDREVAVKVLPAGVAADPDALARFDREAKAVAALAHPNIVAIYDLGTEGDRAYAAMELLDGETLRARLESGPLPPRKAATIARQIARGLGAAHDRGIVHRDLKPDNVFLTRDGQAKILDFGLAVEREDLGDAANDPAMPTRTSLTTPGTVMGTVGYMAPEQVRGEAVDHRADVFAFGSVLYEVLSGRRAFERETAPETMTAILREEPVDLDTGSGAVPPALESVVRRCLEKNPDERFQSARDLAFAIDNAVSASGAAVAEAAPSSAPRKRSTRPWLAVALAAVVGLVAGWIAATSLRSPPPAPEPVRVRMLTTSGRDTEPTAAPDGRIVAFRSMRGDGTPRIWIRQMAGGGEQPLTDGPESGYPLSSPVYTASGDIVMAAAESLLGDQGATLSRIVRFDPQSGEVTTLLWSPYMFPLQGVRSDLTRIDILGPEKLVFHQTSVRQTIRIVDAAGTGEEVSASLRSLTHGQSRDRQPIWSRDGRHIVFSSNRSGNLDLWSVDAESGALRQITDDAAQDWDPGFTPDGRRIVWSSDRSGHLEI